MTPIRDQRLRLPGGLGLDAEVVLEALEMLCAAAVGALGVMAAHYAWREAQAKAERAAYELAAQRQQRADEAE